MNGTVGGVAPAPVYMSGGFWSRGGVGAITCCAWRPTSLAAVSFHAVPAGCVASIGGLDQALGKIVASALVEEVNKAGGAAFAMPLLLTTWQANTRSRRLATPFARMADVFFTQLDVRAMPEADAALTDVLPPPPLSQHGCRPGNHAPAHRDHTSGWLHDIVLDPREEGGTLSVWKLTRIQHEKRTESQTPTVQFVVTVGTFELMYNRMAPV